MKRPLLTRRGTQMQHGTMTHFPEIWAFDDTHALPLLIIADPVDNRRESIRKAG